MSYLNRGKKNRFSMSSAILFRNCAYALIFVLCIMPGRNDGINRVYTNNVNVRAFEYTWNGTTCDSYNMGGGSGYLYGMHYGAGRNNGLIRFYGADRGSVNRVTNSPGQLRTPWYFLIKRTHIA